MDRKELTDLFSELADLVLHVQSAQRLLIRYDVDLENMKLTRPFDRIKTDVLRALGSIQVLKGDIQRDAQTRGIHKYQHLFE